MDFSKLTITELAAYADLCEKRKVELFRDMNLYRGDTSLRNKYQDLLKVCEKLTKEIDRRLFENNDESDCADEKTLAED